MNNIKVLERWNNDISKYPKYSYKEALNKYREMISTNDETKKKEIRQDLILGTLHVIYQYISKKQIAYLNSTSYDINDVINGLVETLINIIDSGQLLKYTCYSDLYHAQLTKGLDFIVGDQQFNIASKIDTTLENFVDTIYKYILIKQSGKELSQEEFDEFMKENNCESYNFQTKALFDAICKSIKLDDVNMEFTSKTIDRIKYLLINNGYEYLKKTPSNINSYNNTEKVLENMYNNELIRYAMETSYLTDRERTIITERYGLDGKERKSYNELAIKLKCSIGRVQYLEVQALRKIMCSINFYQKEFDNHTK